jgi:hypothetical protein
VVAGRAAQHGGTKNGLSQQQPRSSHGREPVVAGHKKLRRVIMHISRRAAIVGAAVLVLASLGAAGAAGAALASPTAPAAHAGAQVLRLHTVEASSADNPAGHGGPGDMFAVVYDLQTLAGAEAGKAYLSCTQATASVNLCHAAYVLHGGQIDVQVAVLPSATNETLAVTGGTGIYAGVTGWARAVDADRTFYLTRPGQG